MTLIVVPAVLGGMGTVWGPVVGSIIIPIGLFLAQLSHSGGIAGLNNLVYGAALILVLRFYPGGLTAIGAALRRSTIFSDRNKRTVQRVRSIGVGHSAGIRLDTEDNGVKRANLTVPEVSRPGSLGSVLLEVNDVRKHFGGVHALQGVTFSVDVGEIIGLIGPNGAGKSTMFNCIAGVESSDSGVVRLDGRDITRVTSYERARAGISRTYQTVRLFPQLTVLENVAVGTLRRSGWETAAHRAAAMLESVGLADKGAELAGSLTLVDQRRLELARAMVTDARLVMLDEVMTGLNEKEVEGMRVMVRELNDYHSTAFVIVEHVMSHIRPLISRVVVMDQGRVLADGNPEVVLKRTDVVEAYFGRSVAEGDNDGV
jgi:ABC-type branched-subunit amino acid transport system ATPase component